MLISHVQAYIHTGTHKHTCKQTDTYTHTRAHTQGHVNCSLIELSNSNLDAEARHDLTVPRTQRKVVQGSPEEGQSTKAWINNRILAIKTKAKAETGAENGDHRD